MFFSSIYDEYEKNTYTKAFYNYFQNMDLRDFNFDRERPISKSYEHMQETNIPVMALFLEEYLNEIEWDDNIINNTYDNMFRNYNNFIVKDRYDKSTLSKKAFCSYIKNYNGIEDGKRTAKTKTIEMDRIKLTNCLNKKYNMKIEQPDIKVEDAQ